MIVSKVIRLTKTAEMKISVNRGRSHVHELEDSCNQFSSNLSITKYNYLKSLIKLKTSCMIKKNI
jgi:hypothetical protein